MASRWIGIAIAFAVVGGSWAASPYDVPAQNATNWLIQHYNPVDGSWGATDDVKYVQTSEAVIALGALNRRTPQYYAGLAWLENHSPANVDFRARRILALQASGNNILGDLQYLQTAQNLAAPGNGGWGLSNIYQGSALDSALSLQALSQAGVSTNVSSAISYLTGTQLTGSDKGWVIGQESTSDPATTAHAVIALLALQPGSQAAANGLTTLNSKVNGSSPVAQQALAVLANLRSNPTSSQAATLLSNLMAVQSGDGSWGQDVYATALAVRALAAGMGRDLAAQKQLVSLPDANLRSAINQALGRNALDALNVGELGQLTSLTASSLNISNLTGLQYATNLKNLDLRNNNITDFGPVAGLTGATILESGNPGYVAIPTLPEWGIILMGALLLLTMMRAQRRV